MLNGGFLGTYYPNANFSGAPAFQRRDVRLEFNWSAAGPGGSRSPEYAAVGPQGFSINWLGSVKSATTETYTFSMTVTGGVSLSIRPTGSSAWTSLISDSGTGQRSRQASYALTAGQSYDLQILNWQNAGAGVTRLAWSSPTVASQTLAPATPMGLNIGYAGANDPDLIFADAVKQSYPFQIYSDHTDASHPAAVDVNGWPTQDATLPIWTSLSETGGTYQLRFNGEAQVVDWLGAGSFSFGGVTYGTTLPLGVGYSAATNTTTATWTISASAAPKAVWLGFSQTRRTSSGGAGTGITNVALLRPLGLNSTQSHAPGEQFTADFKTLVGRFTAIRFMDYLATLSNQQVNWTDRIKPGDWSQFQPKSGYGYQGKGGSWEYLVALANETGKDIWINIPVNASNDYVTKVAQLLAYGSDGTNPYTSAQTNPIYPPLNSNLKIYVEYSNEIWNAYFPQHQQLRVAANAEVAAGGSPLNYDGSTDPAVWFKRRFAERLKQISDLFRAVWGNQAMLATIRPVFEFEYGDTGSYGQTGLNFLDAYYDNGDGVAHVSNPVPVNSYIWGAGGGWYATVNNDCATSISAMYSSGMSMSVPQSTIADSNLTRAFGLAVAGYEGGFYIDNHCGSTSTSQQALQLQANYASPAASFETQSVNLFYHYGGDMPFVFNGVGGIYGVAGPTVHEQNTPKLAGLAQAMATGPAARTVGQAVPATLPVSKAAYATGTTALGGTLAQPAQYIDWTLNLTTAGKFTISTDTATPAAQQIYVDGMPVGSGPWTGVLGIGLHGIRVQDIGKSGMSLRNLNVAAAP
ncbi:hypothetical protein GCM10011611_06670 [Aliidongia dinghuensis]|uniref:PA14 domain-containing protein n=1 Tax=Aliidongia dinghuensis TaxID=1867774 RepID=A0A8J2YR69_9PROT|nr:PA14 domain-containing protein [Aliidongia dinghuensis]GGF03870.1 hypothetical protein GCM10011611_06670 [Aliidongia dinghuensis]